MAELIAVAGEILACLLAARVAYVWGWRRGRRFVQPDLGPESCCVEGKHVRDGGHAWWYHRNITVRKCNVCGKVEIPYRVEAGNRERRWKFPTEPRPASA